MVDSIYNAASKAYANAAKIAPQAKSTQAEGDAPLTTTFGQAGSQPNNGKMSFPALLEGSIDRSIATTYKGEDISIKAMLGKADLHEMVSAITQTELTLQAVVAVRDRVINAYQDILKMPI
ncbi:flagellar hook-basal body complex protein FliE [bacterium]|nr:flagellar hook-basal body complex protein FliE [bacterium]